MAISLDFGARRAGAVGPTDAAPPAPGSDECLHVLGRVRQRRDHE
jgi:hypothetical protein